MVPFKKAGLENARGIHTRAQGPRLWRMSHTRLTRVQTLSTLDMHAAAGIISVQSG